MFDNELHYYDVVDGQPEKMVSIKKFSGRVFCLSLFKP